MLHVFLLIVVGLSGDPEHAKLFHAWGTSLANASEKLGVTNDHLVYLVDQPLEGDAHVTGKATREEITKAVDGFAKEATKDDLVFVTLIGHGTADGGAAKFNLPGPDMSGADFDALLKKLPTNKIVFVDTTSSSGPFVEDLSAPGRTIVTATRNGAEQYDTLFGGYFVEALTSEAADADKNKEISVLEAFQYAKTEVARAYEKEGLLSTEHAMLDDNGDKAGTQDPSATGKDGRIAAVLSLGSTEAANLPSDPKLRALYLERRSLERQVESLRLLKDSMDPAKYESELEKLATDIALKTRDIRAAGGN
ncbi:MAG TPA: caspase family protein [Vicinamibacterales bacterium]|nr:caspase family protein [Vicinamibacterales bacterium]